MPMAPAVSAILVGAMWCLLALVGVGFAAALCHRGSDIGETVVDLLRLKVLGGRR